MKKIFIFLIPLFMFSCSANEETDEILMDETYLMDDTLTASAVISDSISISQDTLIALRKDSIRDAYENDLSLEIKEIEEEKIDPITEDCKLFLEDYAASISSFASLLESIEKNPENINLIIARSSQEEEMYAYSSNPQMFQCIQNTAFQKQIDILNNKREKLISN
tara:strand:+ start:118 stop:615 length:498 start_codon:yes stop_codon:yes gene_type:complete